MRRASKLLNILTLICACYFSNLVQGSDSLPLVERAQQQIENRNWQAAVDELLSHETKYAGVPQFDYLLGVALLGNQQPSIAIQVLQRAIDIAPNFKQARYSLATALFDVGDYQRAKFHFELLLKLIQDSHTQLTISRYLAAIDVASRAYKPYLSNYIEMSMGYDSNANTATSDDTFLGFTLTSDNIESESPYASLALGGLYRYPIDPYWRFSTSAKLQSRINSQAHFVDSDRLEITTNLGRFTDFGRFYGRLAGHYTLLDNAFNNRRAILDFGIDYKFNKHLTLNLNSQLQDKQYRTPLAVRDALSYGLASSLIYHFDNGFDQIALNLGHYKDDADLNNSPYSNRQHQFQVYARQAIGQQSYWQLQGVYMQVDYDANTPFFGKQRKDYRSMLSMSYHWLEVFKSKLQLSAQVDLIDNRANVPLYQFDKIKFGLTVKQSFD